MAARAFFPTGVVRLAKKVMGAQQRITLPAKPGQKGHWWQIAVLTAFFASGASGLVLELVWTRQFALVFGTTEAALSAVLAAYMAGLAIGSYVFGRWCRRWLKPLWLYAGLEVGVAVFALFLGLAIPRADFVLRAIWSTFPQSATLLATVRFVLAFGIVVISESATVNPQLRSFLGVFPSHLYALQGA